MTERRRDDGVEVAYHCPSCAALVRVWQPIGPYYLRTGPCLICASCDAVIAVRLEVVIPGKRGPG